METEEKKKQWKLGPISITVTVTKNDKEVIPNMKEVLKDILMYVSWREVSRNYFGKSSSWFYHKMDGIDGNGGVGGFDKEEAETLRNALYDLSERIEKAADNI